MPDTTHPIDESTMIELQAHRIQIPELETFADDKPKKHAKLLSDERDRIIGQQSGILALMTNFAFVVLAGIIISFLISIPLSKMLFRGDLDWLNIFLTFIILLTIGRFLISLLFPLVSKLSIMLWLKHYGEIEERIGKPRLWVSKQQAFRGDTLDIHYRQGIAQTLHIHSIKFQLVRREFVLFIRDPDNWEKALESWTQSPNDLELQRAFQFDLPENVVVEVIRPSEIIEGGLMLEHQVKIRIPHDVMHSFHFKKSGHTILWLIKVVIDAENLNFSEVYEIQVRPDGEIA